MLPRYLPDDWKGGFVLLAMVFVLSSFLDNIAAALIGGAMAHTVFRGKVHIGYLAAIVAASNAGGSGSVVGDTTTTMMWIAGVQPARGAARPTSRGRRARRLRHPGRDPAARYSPIVKDAAAGRARRLGARRHRRRRCWSSRSAPTWSSTRTSPSIADRFPFLGVAVWVALLATAPLRKPDW